MNLKQKSCIAASLVLLAISARAANTFPSSGYVGINTVSPVSALHLAQGYIVADYVANATTSSSIRGLKARGTSAVPLPPLAADYLFYIGGGGYNGSSLFTHNKVLIGLSAAENWNISANGTYITFETTPNGSTERAEIMRIDQSGNVGIGTEAPTEKLSVNGKIRAKEIVVDTGWSDYVFEPGYRLAPLAEVEQHIKEKGRLPDVPSAQEVAEKGVSMGESQALLLRKVEELTLHLISQEKMMVAQQKAMLAQEKEMAKLRNEVVRLSANSGPAQ